MRKERKKQLGVKRAMLLVLAASCMGVYTGCTGLDADSVEQLNVGTEENAVYVEMGESLPDYYTYTDESGEKTSGLKGLEYQINQVTIYDSIHDAKINASECDDAYDAYAETRHQNQFILVDITADYHDDGVAPEIREHMVKMDFFGWSFLSDGNQELDENHLTSAEPQLVYFSEHPNDGDIDPYTQKELRKNRVTISFETPSKMGTPFIFKLALWRKKKESNKKMYFWGFAIANRRQMSRFTSWIY